MNIDANHIKMIALDVDGTLTNGQILLMNINDYIVEAKSFNVKDGMGIVEWIRRGGLVSIISGRESTIVEHRAKELGIHEVCLGVDDKLMCLNDICKKYNISPSNIACIGDDVNDIVLYDVCAYSFAPSDSSPINLAKACFVTKAAGGHGAVREMIDMLLGAE